MPQVAAEKSQAQPAESTVMEDIYWGEQTRTQRHTDKYLSTGLQAENPVSSQGPGALKPLKGRPPLL